MKSEMENNFDTWNITSVSIEKIAENIRNVRDQSIDELLIESKLMHFIEAHFNTVAISKVKLEFLRRDLRELKSASLDLAHYSSLIKKMKESNSIIPDNNHPSFLIELKTLFEKHGFKVGS